MRSKDSVSIRITDYWIFKSLKSNQKREVNLALLSFMLEHAEEVLKFSHFAEILPETLRKVGCFKDGAEWGCMGRNGERWGEMGLYGTDGDRAR